VEGAVPEGKVGGVREVRLELGIGLARGGEHRRRGVDCDHGVPERLQVAREPALAAAEVEGAAARWPTEIEELIAVEVPVAVETGLTRPGDELKSVLLPGSAEVRGRKSRSLEWTVRTARHGHRPGSRY
jgi:hypothetical protein